MPPIAMLRRPPATQHSAKRPVRAPRCRVWPLVAMVTLLDAADLSACPVCYSATDPVIVSSLNAGIFVLLGVTGVVLAGFLRFVVSLIRRSQSVPVLEHHQTQT